jgi:DNA polymerase-3 subunit gamma/tau
VLSRCQRFDLRRIEAGRLIALMRDITAKEGVSVDDAALTMVARAAEGSARDALSLLDQAIAHASGPVSGEEVRQMLGLADRAMVIDLFEDVMRGDIAAALGRLKDLHDVGADPAVVLEDLAAFTHIVTRLKLAPAAAEDEALTEEEKGRGKEFAGKLSLRTLARAWQMLLKGIEEAKESSRPLAAADMVVVRLSHAADLPTPDEALKSLSENGGTASRPRAASSAPPPEGRTRMAAAGGARSAMFDPAPSPAPLARTMEIPRLESFADLVAYAGQKRELKLKHALESTVRPIRFESGKIEIALTEHASPGLAGELSRKLEQWTGARWMVAVSREGGGETVAEARKNARAKLVDDARADPVVAAVFSRFPGAEIVDVRVRGVEGEAPDPGEPEMPAPDDRMLENIPFEDD